MILTQNVIYPEIDLACGKQNINAISDTHTGLKYRPSTAPTAPLRVDWKPSELKSGQKLNQPSPLFKKLDESVIEEERARLGN